MQADVNSFVNLCVLSARFHNEFTVYGFVYWFVQFSSTDERFLSERVMAMVKSQDLPLTIKTPTQGNDNCFFRALCDLLQEPFITRGLSDDVLSVGSDHLQLRQAVVDFLRRLDDEGYNVLFNTEKAKVIQVLRCNFTFLLGTESYLLICIAFCRGIREHLHFSSYFCYCKTCLTLNTWKFVV